MLYKVYHKLENGRLGASEVEAESPESAKDWAERRQWEVVHVEPADHGASCVEQTVGGKPSPKSETKSVILALALSLGLCALVLTIMGLDWSKLKDTIFTSIPQLGGNGSSRNVGFAAQRPTLAAKDVKGIAVERRDLDYERSMSLFKNAKTSDPIDAAARLQIQRDWDRQPSLGVQYELSGSLTNPHSVAFSHIAITIQFKDFSGDQKAIVTIETDYLGPRQTWRFKESVGVDAWINRHNAEVVRIATNP